MHTKCYLLIGLSNDYSFLNDACNRVLAYIVKYRDSSVSCAKTAEPIKMQFGTLSGEHVLHWGVDAFRGRGTFGVVRPIKTHRKAYDIGGGYKIIDGCSMYVSQHSATVR